MRIEDKIRAGRFRDTSAAESIMLAPVLRSDHAVQVGHRVEAGGAPPPHFAVLLCPQTLLVGDNAAMENWNRSFKVEAVHSERFQARAEANKIHKHAKSNASEAFQ